MALSFSFMPLPFERAESRKKNPFFRPSIRSAPNDSDRLRCGISRAATVQKSLVKSCAVKLLQFRRHTMQRFCCKFREDSSRNDRCYK